MKSTGVCAAAIVSMALPTKPSWATVFPVADLRAAEGESQVETWQSDGRAILGRHSHDEAGEDRDVDVVLEDGVDNLCHLQQFLVRNPE